MRTSHPIAVAARRAGLSKDVLRAWERRYGAVRPSRTENGRRRYTDADIERLQLLARLTRDGRTISELAGMHTDELLAFVNDEEGRATAPSASTTRQAAACVEGCVRAAIDLDDAALRVELERAVISLSPVVLLDDVVAPLMARLGHLWAADRLRPGHERIATGVVTATLRRLIDTLQPTGAAPLVLVGTLSGQRHELGAMLAAAAAAAEAWRVTYLGPELPPEEFAHAARLRRARAVALGILIPEDDPGLVDDLRRLAVLLPDGVAVVAGGAGAPAYAPVLESIGARTTTSLADFRALLQGLRRTARSNGR